jgi:hypothetical protein
LGGERPVASLDKINRMATPTPEFKLRKKFIAISGNIQQ